MANCPACGKENVPGDRFCSGCGIDLVAAGVPGAATSQWLAQGVAGPQETNGKAIASMVTGLFCFFWPVSVVAIVLGHIARNEIKKSGGRQTGAGMALAGLILGYFGVSLVPILILAAIAIPNLLRSRIAANEASTVGSLRSLNTVEVSYMNDYGQFAPNLKSLGPPPNGAKADATAADLIDSVLANGMKSGYFFRYAAYDTDGDGKIDAYHIQANPVTPGTTGMRYFFTNQTGIIRVETSHPADAKSPPI